MGPPRILRATRGRARPQHSGVGIEWRVGTGQEVRIDKVAAIGVQGQEFGGERGFPCTIGPGNDVTVGTRSFSGLLSQNSTCSI